MASTSTEVTYGAAAHMQVRASSPVRAGSVRYMHTKEHLHAGSKHGSTSGMDGLTYRVVGKRDVEEARDHKRPTATLSTMQQRFIPVTKACVCGSARPTTPCSGTWKWRPFKHI